MKPSQLQLTDEHDWTADNSQNSGTVLCTYGPPAERKRYWLLKFDDPDKGTMHFNDEVEAMRAWDRCRDNWTCTLFVTAEFVPHSSTPSSSKPKSIGITPEIDTMTENVLMRGHF